MNDRNTGNTSTNSTEARALVSLWKRVDDRRVINGIFYVLRTGIPWADLPEQYGPPTTVYNRFNRWSYAGHWDRIMDAIADAHKVEMVMVDGTSLRAHHSATILRKRSTPLFKAFRL